MKKGPASTASRALIVNPGHLGTDGSKAVKSQLGQELLMSTCDL